MKLWKNYKYLKSWKIIKLKIKTFKKLEIEINNKFAFSHFQINSNIYYMKISSLDNMNIFLV